MTPLVSVVMASKNYARFLPAAIGSVLAQTFSNWELIIVDDGSTDDTPATMLPYRADPRIRYIPSDKLGQSRAKSLGVRFARGEFVAFLDADDIWEPTKLEKQLALFRVHPQVGVVFCRRRLIDESGNLLPPRPFSPPRRGRVLPELFVQNFVCFSSAMIHRSILSHVGAFDTAYDLAIDYDLWLRVARHHDFDYVDEELVQYRTGHGNLSRKLLDRVGIVLSIMHRARERHGIANNLPPAQVAEAFASTYRTIGYVLRRSEPVAAAGWYLKALQYRSERLASFKGLIACVLCLARWQRTPGPPENAIINR